MKPFQFLISCVVLFLLLAASYALVIDRLVIPGQVLPFPYNQFLLESTAPIEGKVVISSGSNSIHSFDTQILSDYFQAPVIIAADSAANPLRYKIFNFYKYLKPGDILILPLEWRSYRAEAAFSEPFLENIIQHERAYDYYYTGLPIVEKLNFIFRKLPLKMVLDFFLRHDEVNIVPDIDGFERLKMFERRLQGGDNRSFGGVVRDGPEKFEPHAALNTCDSYVFGNEKDGHFGEISEAFLSNVDLLAKLAEKGVSIYFVWPTVVDSNTSVCYESAEVREGLERYTASLEDLVESRGFQFLGEPEDSHFDSKCFLNTYYHIRYSCAIERTNSFVEALSQNAVGPLNTTVNRGQIYGVINEYVESRREQLLEEKAKDLPALTEGVVTALEQETKILFREGWSGNSDKGTWSIGTESVFEIRIDASLLKHDYIYLGIDGYYFNGTERTKVEINGIPYGAEILNNQIFKIPTAEIFSQRILVQLRYSDVRSPKMLGESNDARMIKFRLQSLSLSLSDSG
jgi:hypothetical protein